MSRSPCSGSLEVFVLLVPLFRVLVLEGIEAERSPIFPEYSEGCDHVVLFVRLHGLLALYIRGCNHGHSCIHGHFLCFVAFLFAAHTALHANSIKFLYISHQHFVVIRCYPACVCPFCSGGSGVASFRGEFPRDTRKERAKQETSIYCNKKFKGIEKTRWQNDNNT